MPTYLDVQNHISEELRGYSQAGDSGLVSLIKSGILWAIRHYQHNLFWFNNGLSYAQTTSVAERYALPGDYLGELSVTAATADNTRRWVLERRSDQHLDIDSLTSSHGEPKLFSIWAGQLRLSPPPDGIYLLYLRFVKALPLPVLDADTSVWFDYAFDLIAFTVEARLASSPLRDPQLASELNSMAQQEFAILQDRTLASLAVDTLLPQEL